MRYYQLLYCSIFAEYDYFYDTVDYIENKKNKDKQHSTYQDSYELSYSSYDYVPSAQSMSAYISNQDGKNEEGAVDPEKGHNGHQCWRCRDVSYADCQTNGAIVNCKAEQFHCNIRENRQFGVVTKVNMGKITLVRHIS